MSNEIYYNQQEYDISHTAPAYRTNYLYSTALQSVVSLSRARSERAQATQPFSCIKRNNQRDGPASASAASN
eukprot:5716420-Pleurochrysis_carterae.AAC.1